MSRCYTINQIEFPSVTTILGLLDKPFLLKWAAEQAVKHLWGIITSKPEIVKPDQSMCNIEGIIQDSVMAFQKVSGEAKDIGSQVHQLLEYYVKAKINNTSLPSSKDYDEEAKLCFNQFLIWEDQYKPVWIASEMTVYNTDLGYAGTLDAVCLINEKICVIDFKTDKQISDTYPMQISAYKAAYNLMLDQLNGPINRASSQGILRLPKNGDTFEWIDYTDSYERNMVAFAGLLQYYYYSKKRRLKNNPVVKRIWN